MSTQQCEELGLPFYEVDGSHSAEEMSERVERHFDPYLLSLFKQEQNRNQPDQPAPRQA